MKKLARVDVDDFKAWQRGKRPRKFQNPLVVDLVEIIKQRTGDYTLPFFDNEVVRWELWLDGRRVFVRVFRPRPKGWPGGGRVLMRIDYTVARIPRDEEVTNELQN